jgi:hypothetical protein
MTGNPFGLRCSAGWAPDPTPSYDEPSADLNDLCDWDASSGGRRPGLRLGGRLLNSGVIGRPTNSEFDDWGVSV